MPDQLKPPWPLKRHAYKTASSAALDIPTPFKYADGNEENKDKLLII